MIFKKSQSAMEYLMTYGWAIILIAVVLGVLFQLGVFSSGNITPKAQPGSCQVIRENTATQSLASFAGSCVNEVPEYTGSFDGDYGGFSYPSGYDSNSFITATVSSTMSGTNVPFTITMWIYVPTNFSKSNIPVFGMSTYQAYEYFRGGVSTSSEFMLHRCNSADTAESSLPLMSFGRWHFIAVSVSAPNYRFMLDGNSTTVTNGYDYNFNNNVVIGTQQAQCDGTFFTGGIADVQLYNTSLSVSELKTLYLEGIGGDPIDLSSLVGWWPLNGNAQDYSGNNYNGQINGHVSFNGSWIGSYVPPSAT
jgi:hypothetical protein